MNLLKFKWAAILAVAALLAGCLSIPTPDKGKGTLLVIPLEHDLQISESAWYDYFLEIAEAETDKKVKSVMISKSKDYLLVSNLPPGDYYISGYKWRTRDRLGDLNDFYKTFAPFTLEKGVLTMSPIGFGWRTWKSDEGYNRFTMTVHKKMDGEIQNRTLTELYREHNEEMAAWTVRNFEPENYLETIKRIASTSNLEQFELEFDDVLTGRHVSMNDLRGKVVVIDFWASWCNPCVREIPNMLALYDKWKDQGVEFVGVSLDKNPEAVKQFCGSRGMSWPQYCEAGKVWDTEFSRGWGVHSIPRLFILDKQGRIVSMEARGRLEEMIPMVLDL